MHPIELKIMEFMKTVGKTSVKVDDLPLKPSQGDVEHFLRKMYEDDPAKPFTIRMSNVGKPICQLQMEQNKADKVEDDWNLPLRFMYGAIIEGLTVSLLRHAGVNIEEEQTKVKLPIGGIEINGTLDLVIDGRVWDIKSASPYSFKEKFASYETLAADDDFGYLPQLYGYAAARGIAPGGFVVIDKASGNVKVIEVPLDYTQEMTRCLTIIETNANVLVRNEAFRRSFTDTVEVFKKRPTGNQVLESPCTFCKYKYSCWPGLKHLPSFSSSAYEKPYKYYTKVSELYVDKQL